MRRYELVRVLGHGGMAQVYEARLIAEHGVERRVAIKRVLPQHCGDEEFRTMFWEEARVAARLHHDNVVAVLDFGRVDGQEFLVMDFVDGIDAQRAIKRLSPMPLPMACYVARDLAAAVHYHGATLSVFAPPAPTVGSARRTAAE